MLSGPFKKINVQFFNVNVEQNNKLFLTLHIYATPFYGLRPISHIESCGKNGAMYFKKKNHTPL